MDPDSFADSRQLNSVTVVKTRLSQQLYLCVRSKLCIHLKKLPLIVSKAKNISVTTTLKLSS